MFTILPGSGHAGRNDQRNRLIYSILCMNTKLYALIRPVGAFGVCPIAFSKNAVKSDLYADKDFR